MVSAPCSSGAARVSQATRAIPPDDGGVRSLAAALGTALDTLEIGGRVRFQAELVAEEILTNLVKYSSAPCSGEPVEMVLQPTAAGLLLSVIDRSQPFDPRRAQEPLRPATVDNDTSGGLGLHLVRGAAARLDYGQLPDGRNRLDVWIVAADPVRSERSE